MPLRASISFKSRREVVESAIGKFVDVAAKRSALVMEREVKVSATQSFTQRTGNLRRSIRANTSMPFGEARIEINPVREGADVNYGKYLEYGTRYMAPRAFIRKGVKAAEPRIKKVFAEEAKKVHDSVGEL